MRKDIIEMSKKELERIEVVHEILGKSIKQKDAASFQVSFYLTQFPLLSLLLLILSFLSPPNTLILILERFFSTMEFIIALRLTANYNSFHLPNFLFMAG